MTTVQISALRWLSLLAGASLSLAVPLLLVVLDVRSELALKVFAPGFSLMSPVHNVLPALIVTVVFDALVYCLVAYATLTLLLRLFNTPESG